jgi:hypothetical protein
MDIIILISVSLACLARCTLCGINTHGYYNPYICISGMPSEVYLMWHKYPWIFGHLACDAKIVITEGISYAAVGTVLVCSAERLVVYTVRVNKLSI